MRGVSKYSYFAPKLWWPLWNADVCHQSAIFCTSCQAKRTSLVYKARLVWGDASPHFLPAKPRSSSFVHAPDNFQHLHSELSYHDRCIALTPRLRSTSSFWSPRFLSRSRIAVWHALQQSSLLPRCSVEFRLSSHHHFWRLHRTIDPCTSFHDREAVCMLHLNQRYYEARNFLISRLQIAEGRQIVHTILRLFLCSSCSPIVITTTPSVYSHCHHLFEVPFAVNLNKRCHVLSNPILPRSL
jgi:hypothetical protein